MATGNCPDQIGIEMEPQSAEHVEWHSLHSNLVLSTIDIKIVEEKIMFGF